MTIVADKAQVIATARSTLGYVEKPVNRTRFGVWYGMDGVPWCAIWLSWVFWHSGNPLPRITTAKGFAYVPEVVRYGQETDTWRRGAEGIAPGDIAVWWFPGGPDRPNHVSIVAERGLLPDGRIHTLDGNSNVAGSRTGGGVVELHRRTGFHGYVRVTPKTPTPPAGGQEDDDMAREPKHYRLEQKGHPQHGRIELIGDFDRRHIPPHEWALHTWLKGPPAQNVNLDGWLALTSNKRRIG
jgi:hypothetical protein